jgi:hypothetical protein
MKPETQHHQTQREAILQSLDTHGLSPYRDELEGLLKPAIGLQTRAVTEADLAVGATRVGGEPDLPPDLPWPVGEEGPLLFVLQVSLIDVAPLDVEGLLPGEGLLSVFSDPFASDVRVLHHAPGLTLQRRPTPSDSRRPAFRACGVDLLPELHLPPPQSELVTLPSDAFDIYWDEVWLPWRDTLRPGAAGECGIHQLLGYAVAERDEAQGPHDEVLVGFDSDDRAAMEWGDVHCVWALIDRTELRARNFGALRPEM